MKVLILVLAITLQCIIRLDGYKLKDQDYLIGNNNKQYHLDDILYPANRQGSLFDDADDSASYKSTLAALADAAAAEENNYEEPNESNEMNRINEYFGQGSSNFYDTELKADARDEEIESHSSLGAGHQYVSGKCLNKLFLLNHFFNISFV